VKVCGLFEIERKIWSFFFIVCHIFLTSKVLERRMRITFICLTFNLSLNCYLDFHWLLLSCFCLFVFFESQRFVQWNLSNPTHKGTREMCQIVQDVGILWFYFSKQKYCRTINFCRKTQVYDCTSSTIIGKLIQ
jgi:hypothetical protein